MSDEEWRAAGADLVRISARGLGAGASGGLEETDMSLSRKPGKADLGFGVGSSEMSPGHSLYLGSGGKSL